MTLFVCLFTLAVILALGIIVFLKRDSLLLKGKATVEHISEKLHRNKPRPTDTVTVTE